MYDLKILTVFKRLNLDTLHLLEMGNKGTRITFDERLRGTNVALSKGGVVASRVNKATTEQSLVFVQQEIMKGAKLQIRIEEKIKQAEGTMVRIQTESVWLGPVWT